MADLMDSQTAYAHALLQTADRPDIRKAGIIQREKVVRPGSDPAGFLAAAQLVSQDPLFLEINCRLCIDGLQEIWRTAS